MCRDASAAARAYWIRFGRIEDSPDRKHAGPAAAHLDVVSIILRWPGPNLDTSLSQADCEDCSCGQLPPVRLSGIGP
jgi:hypothetical protein